MATVRTTLDLIIAALQVIGAYSVAQPTAAEDAQIGFDTLQDLLAEWSDGGLMVPCTVMEAVALVVGQEVYTIGESGTPDLTTIRPEQIVRAFVRDASGDEFPVDIIGEGQYRALVAQGLSVGRPDCLFPKYSAPNATIYLYPEPNAIELLFLVSIKPFIEPTVYTENLLTTTELPRNYFNALKWNLALELCTPFLREPTPLIVKRALETKNYIRKLNMARSVAPVSLGVIGSVSRYNILEG
jgi:hypothetical protein